MVSKPDDDLKNRTVEKTFSRVQEAVKMLKGKLKGKSWVADVSSVAERNKDVTLNIRCYYEPEFSELFFIFLGYPVKFIWDGKIKQSIHEVSAELSCQYSNEPWFSSAEVVGRNTIEICIFHPKQGLLNSYDGYDIQYRRVSLPNKLATTGGTNVSS